MHLLHTEYQGWEIKLIMGLIMVVYEHSRVDLKLRTIVML